MSTVFQDNFKEKVSRCFKSVSMKFCFVILFCDFVVARISSQLPEQKEGLFDFEGFP